MKKVHCHIVTAFPSPCGMYVRRAMGVRNKVRLTCIAKKFSLYSNTAQNGAKKAFVAST